jgi:hypothetical protein
VLDPESAELARPVLVLGAVRSIAIARPVRDRCEDPDPAFALAAKALPGAVTGHPRGIRVLREDEQDVPEAVLVEPSGGREHRAPPIAVDELGDLAGELLVQRLELLASILIALRSLLAGERSAASGP